MTVLEDSPVGELAVAMPASVRVFQRHGLDFCCGGSRSLAELCEEAGLSVTDIAREIEVEAHTPGVDVRDWTTEPLASLIDHIIATYHGPLRAALPQLQATAATVVRAHGAKSPIFARLQAIVDELSIDLLQHMAKEEGVLFPAIRRVASGQAAGLPLMAPIGVMEAEHQVAGALLREIRTLTDDYVPPVWACTTLRAFYGQLEWLETEMHVHVHLENNVLFRRATDRAAVRG